MQRAPALTVLAGVALFASSAAASEPPPAADLDLVKRTRTALAEIRRFERLNEAIVKLCHEPVTSSYADWRDDWRADLQRAGGLAQSLERRLPSDPKAAPSIEESLRPFTGAEGQVLSSECLRWGTALIQHESRIRGDFALRFELLKRNEAHLREIIANDFAWDAWLAGGALP